MSKPFEPISYAALQQLMDEDPHAGFSYIWDEVYENGSIRKCCPSIFSRVTAHMRRLLCKWDIKHDPCWMSGAGYSYCLRCGDRLNNPK